MGGAHHALARAGVLAAALATATARAQSWEASLDVRLVDSDATRSFLDGGLGTLRYGSNQSGLQLGRFRLALSEPLGELFALKVDASAWGDPRESPLVDLTEAYLEFRPYPFAGLRTRILAGAFFPPISLANTRSGWESAYTLSSSALDSWVGEELRTIGTQAQIEWLGQRLGYDFNVRLTVAAFGWNEPAGVSLAAHGFAINDRQTTLFGEIGEPGAQPVHGFEVFHEIDGRVGDYAGLEFEYLDRLTALVVHYDNHADPAAFDAVLNEHAWHTSFDTTGLRWEPADGWTAIAQWMQGETSVAPAGVGELEWYFITRYFLLSRSFGPHTLSVRYDLFAVDADPPIERGLQQGHALTLAYGFEPNEHWRLWLEWVRVRSAQSNRLIYLDADPLATDRALQLSIRYRLASG
jgi:hypothetical protein